MNKCALAALILSIFLAGPAQAKLIGDFNSDGEISIADVIAFALNLTGKMTVPEIGKELSGEVEIYPKPTMGLDGSNDFVFEENVGLVHPPVLKIVNNLFFKIWPASSQFDPRRFMGDSYGYADLYFTASDYAEEADYFDFFQAADFTAVFHDYSDDGELFLSGRLKFLSYFTVMDVDYPKGEPYNILGVVECTGAYNAIFNYALEIQNIQENLLSVRGRYRVLSWENERSMLGFAGLMPVETILNGEWFQGREEIDIGL